MQIDINRGILARQRLNYIFKELFRKSIHICSSFVPFFLGIAYWPVIAGLGILVSFYSVCEFLRLKGKTIPLISKVTEIAARKRDENKFVLGPVTLVFGILLAALFSKNRILLERISIFLQPMVDGLDILGKTFISC